MKDLHEMSSEELGRLFPIRLVKYNPEWGMLFANEKRFLEDEFAEGFFLTIEHIGSTAIADIMSKPTIDILAEVRKDVDIDNLINTFHRLDYKVNKRPDTPPPHLTFVKGYTSKGFEGQTFHVHVRYEGDNEERYFRDFLLANREAALAYQALKKKLAVKYRYDREGYTRGKTEFISDIMKKIPNPDKLRNQ